MSLPTLIRWPGGAVVIALLGACAGETEMLELAGSTMGTGYSVKVARPPESLPLEPLGDRIAERLEALEDQFSTYRDSSEISRFNAHVGEEWFEISPDFRNVLMRGLAISELSNGAFDMTVGPLVELWGFGASGTTNAVPPQAEIDSLLDATGFDSVEVRASPPAVRRTLTGLKLDFSAIAKGFAVDEICALLDRAGLTAYMVEVGGEVRSRGKRVDGDDWMIGIENPLSSGAADGIHDVVYLRDTAIATSGDYRNYFEYEDERYSHTLDPRTGWPVSHSLASVSVIGRSTTDADALATALMVLGPDLGLQLAERAGIAAQLMVRNDGRLEVLQSPAYQAYLNAR